MGIHNFLIWSATETLLSLHRQPKPMLAGTAIQALWYIIRTESEQKIHLFILQTRRSAFCLIVFGPRATLENIGWGSPLDKFIVKLQTLSPSRQHWKISPARQNWLLSLRQSCYFTMILVLGLSVLASTSLWMSVVLDTTQSAQWLFITHGVLVNPQKGGQGKNTQSCFSFSRVLQE